MDNILPTKYLELITPILLIIIYISSFKGNKQVCDRYMINYFLYIITSICIYLLAGDKIKVKDDNMLLFISFIGIIGLIFAFHYTSNIWLKHLIWISLVSLLGIAFKKVHERYGETEIRSVISKLMIILVICIFIALMFPQYIQPKMEVALFFGLLIVIFLRIIDMLIFKSKYNTFISQLTIFIFSVFVIYDTNRVLRYSKECVKDKLGPNYLGNVIDMFLNIINLFSNLLNLE